MRKISCNLKLHIRILQAILSRLRNLKLRAFEVRLSVRQRAAFLIANARRSVAATAGRVVAAEDAWKRTVFPHSINERYEDRRAASAENRVNAVAAATCGDEQKYKYPEAAVVSAAAARKDIHMFLLDFVLQGGYVIFSFRAAFKAPRPVLRWMFILNNIYFAPKMLLCAPFACIKSA